MKQIVVFTDLDGTLLDHHTYSHAPAEGVLAKLDSLGIPLVCCTSKTFAELVELRKAFNNKHPFIVENGAAIYFPIGYFEGLELSNLGIDNVDLTHSDYVGLCFVEGREYWQAQIKIIGHRFQGSFKTFAEMGVEGIAEATGLDLNDAERAADRGFAEPVQWLSSDSAKRRFMEELSDIGATVLEGGRFLHVGGDADKGVALKKLVKIFAAALGEEVVSISAGDGKNDIAMLDASDYSLIVRSPVNPPPVIHRKSNVWTSSLEGPSGWAQGMIEIFAELGIELESKQNQN